tara:strand:- start:1962 stop:2615 length:654 start_codon:yes stop_codon:yes gene_type:complete
MRKGGTVFYGVSLGVVGIVMVALLVGWAGTQTGWFKTIVHQSAQRALQAWFQQPLVIGDIEGSWTQLVLHNVQLSGLGSDEPHDTVIDVEAIHIKIHIIKGFLDRFNMIESINLVNPRVSVKRDQQGKWPILDMIRLSDPQVQRAFVGVPHIIIEGLHGVYRDEKGWRDDQQPLAKPFTEYLHQFNGKIEQDSKGMLVFQGEGYISSSDQPFYVSGF